MKINVKIAAFGFVYAYASMNSVTAYADDTDIFLGKVKSGTIKPNVLFIMDNSGSMSNATSSTDSTSRIQTMKESFRSIMSSAEGINAGLMRFNDPGGSVLYPVTDIDAPLVRDWIISANTSASNDDASENMTLYGGDGAVTLDSDQLTLGGYPTGLTDVTFTISTNNDDSEEDISDGDIMISGNRIDMDNSQINGFRFQNVTIPNAATVHAAALEMRANNDDSGDVTLRFYGDSSGDSPAFTNTDYDLSGRTSTTNYVDWIPTAWSQGTWYTTTNLSAVVQEIVNYGSWSSGNALSILQSHETTSGRRRASTRNSNTANAAKLHVSYQPSGSTFAQQKVGLRFDNVSIPRGATVTKAYIEMTSATTNVPDGGLDLEILTESNLDAGEFTTATGDLSIAPTLTDIVNWTAGDWTAGETIQTPSLISQVQTLVNDAAWCGGNAIAFYLQPTASTTLNRAIYSFDEGSSRQPRLVVEYDPNTVPTATCNQIVYRQQISSRADDAEENIGTGAVDNNGNVFNMETGQINGLRFENLPLVQGATILEANLIFTANNNDSSSASLTFKAENSLDADNFPESNSEISGRTAATPSVTWDSGSTPALGNWVNDNQYKSPNISALIQPLVSDASWNQSDNGVVILQTTGSGERRAYTWDSSPGGAVTLEIKVNSADLVGGSTGITVRDHLINLVDNLTAETYTPIVDTLYEAARYYRGDSVFWGQTRSNPYPDGNSYSSNTNDRWKRVSDIESIQSGTGSRYLPAGCTDDNLDSTNCVTEEITGNPVYKSPIVESCQANYVILLTDGAANQNHSRDLIKSYISKSDSCINGDNDEKCSEELVEWMAENDMSGAADGDNFINTFTIAFALNDTNAISYLEGLSTAGGGKHFNAGSESQLTDSFNTIIGEIVSRDATFVVPGTTVSQFNRLSHYEDMFFSVFKPNKKPRWEGNLKKYKISRTNANYGRIVAQDDELAVNPSTGFFNTDIKSFWSTSSDPDDGSDVTLGGAAHQLPSNPDNRKVYTYYSGGSKTLSSNPLDESNSAITAAMLNIPGSVTDPVSYREKLLNWARGEDVFDVDGDGSTNDARFEIGDPLHSAPVAITYGGTASAPTFAIFYGTNDGFLHAVDGATGQEHFSFMPELLMKNLPTLYDNAVTDSHPYGVDGNITRWVKDVDGDGIIEATDGDHVYIYFGLRRGGNFYYALDVTDLTSPKLMWQIDGDISPYDEIGQTWSQPLKAKVRVNVSGTQVSKDVLIFGGGYDVDQDTNSVRTADSEGRAIYMVEAGYPSSGTTPALVWRGGPSSSYNLNLSDMKYSIPGTIKAGDTTGDGFVDVMFAGDTGGQIWRFDINNGLPANSLVSGAVIADLATDSDASKARRFYDGVDAATIAYAGQRLIALTAGTGWRANPLDKVVEDRFYMIKQPIAKPASYTKLAESDLYDATANLAGSSDATVAAQAKLDLASTQGWYIRLTNAGEKVLSTGVTANAQTLFTSYVPDAQTDPCNPNPGLGYLYGVNTLDATPFIPNSNGDPVRSVQLDSGNIPSTPTLIVLPDGTTRTLVGPEEEGELIDSDPIHKTYWFDE
ncbi:PilC/PilY family type IV pilus protein [Aurantivibrio plasticivorans]